MDNQSQVSTRYNMNALSAPQSLTLTFRGKSVSVYAEDTPFVIGRDEDQCALVVDTEYASRSHCKITYKEKVFFLEDCSRNGTHMHIGITPPAKLHETSIHLVGKGKFKLGCAIEDDDKDIIEFKLDF